MPAAARSPLRVLFAITTSDFGGAESFLEQQLRHLDRARASPLVLSLCAPGRVGRRIAAAGVPVATLDLAANARLLPTLRAVRRVAALIDEEQVDVVQGLLYRANAVSALAARLSRRRPPVVGGQHGLGPQSGALARWSARATVRLCARLVAVSRAAADEVRRREWTPRERLLVIPSGVDAERFRPGDRGAARRLLGEPEEALLIGAVGRLSPEKGHRHLIDAMGSLAGAARLVLIGEGPARSELERRAHAAGCAARVRFAGFRDDLPAVYPAFDLFVLPSLEEALPIALLEAMACGCAVVATAVGGVPEVLDGSTGVLVPPGAPADLGRAIAELLGAPERRAALGQRARERVAAEWSVASAAQRYLELYQQLARPSA